MSVSFIQLMSTVSPIIQTGNKIDFVASTKQMVWSRVYGRFVSLRNVFCCDGGGGIIQVS